MPPVFPMDVVAHILKQLPIYIQYRTAMGVFNHGCDQLGEFMKREEYYNGRDKHVHADLSVNPCSWLYKYGVPIESSDITPSITCKTRVRNLPDILPKHGIHKIPVWLELKALGMVVGNYFLEISNIYEIDGHTFHIYIKIENEETNRFSVTLKVEVTRTNRFAFRGTKEIVIACKEDVQDLLLFQGDPVHSWEPFWCALVAYEGGPTLEIAYEFVPFYKKYKMGVSKEFLTGLLFN